MEEITKREKLENLACSGSFVAAKGTHVAASPTLQRGLPRRGEAEGPKRPPPPRVHYGVALLCRGVALRRNEGCLATTRLKGKKAPPPPRVHYGVALLRRDVDTVHTRKFSDFCFRTPLIHTRLFRNPNK